MDVLSPMVQFGFAGFSAVLIGIVVWMIKKMSGIFETMNILIKNNTKVIGEFNSSMGDVRDEIKYVKSDQAEHIALTRDMREKLLSRPCMIKEGD